MPGFVETIRLLRPVTLLAAIALLGTGCATAPPASDPEALADYHAGKALEL